MSDSFPDYYAILEIGIESDAEQIKAAYRRQAKRYHPDLNSEDFAGSTDRFQILQEAYEILSNPERRVEYDLEWKVARGIKDPFSGDLLLPQVSEQDWAFACRYFLGLPELSERLKKFSSSLEMRWRNRIFYDREFERADQVAAQAEISFLASLVGKSELLQELICDAIVAPHKSCYDEIMNSLRIFGRKITESRIRSVMDYAVPSIDFSKNNTRIIRTFEYRDHKLSIHDDLSCSIAYIPTRFLHVLSVMEKIDFKMDKGRSIDVHFNSVEYFREKSGITKKKVR